MKYNHYDIEDFLADKDFINWVKQGTGDRHEFFRKWLASDPSNKEEALTAREIIQSLKPEQLDGSDAEYEEVLSKLMQGNYRNSAVRTLFQKAWVRYAAIFLVVSGLTFFVQMKRQSDSASLATPATTWVSKENASGQKSQIRLPDGSVVYLNAASKITYAEKFGENHREIKLTGEAFFYVKENKEKPFVVKSGKVNTTALGTSFNVKAMEGGEEVSVSLVEGEVRVSSGATQDLNAILHPGEKAIAISGELHKTTYSYKDIAWKEGVIVFENASLQEVRETLQRWYGVTIAFNNARESNWRYTGKFRNMSLELVLERMSYTEQFEYNIKNDSIILNFKPMKHLPST